MPRSGPELNSHSRTSKYGTLVKKEATETVPVSIDDDKSIVQPRRSARNLSKVKCDPSATIVAPTTNDDLSPRVQAGGAARSRKRNISKSEHTSVTPRNVRSKLDSAQSKQQYRIISTVAEDSTVSAEEKQRISKGKECLADQFIVEYCLKRGLPEKLEDEPICDELVEVEKMATMKREHFKVIRREFDENQYNEKMNAKMAKANYQFNRKEQKHDGRLANNRRSAAARRVYDITYERELLRKLSELERQNIATEKLADDMDNKTAEYEREKIVLGARIEQLRNLLRGVVDVDVDASSPPPSPRPSPPLHFDYRQLGGDPESDSDNWNGLNQLEDLPPINGFETSPVSNYDTPLRNCTDGSDDVELVENDEGVGVGVLDEGARECLDVIDQPLSSSQEEAAIKQMFPSQ